MLGESGPAQSNDSQSREHLGGLSVHPEAAYTARSPSPSQLPSGPNLLILSSLLHSLLLPPLRKPLLVTAVLLHLGTFLFHLFPCTAPAPWGGGCPPSSLAREQMSLSTWKPYAADLEAAPKDRTCSTLASLQLMLKRKRMGSGTMKKKL